MKSTIEILEKAETQINRDNSTLSFAEVKNLQYLRHEVAKTFEKLDKSDITVAESSAILIKAELLIAVELRELNEV